MLKELYRRPLAAPAVVFCLAAASLLFIPAQPSLRAASISIGRYVLLPDRAQQWMWIRVTGPGEQISRAFVAAQIGDGGAFNGGSDTRPRFQGVAPFPGSVFRSNTTTPQVTSYGLVQTVDIATRSGTVTARGELTTLLVDTAGITAPGSYALRLTNVAPNAPGPPLNTQLFDASGEPVPLSIINGSLFVTFYGDANMDARVDGTDFALLAANFGKTQTHWEVGDFNKDSRVDGSDFALLASNFGRSASSPSPTAASAVEAAMLSAFADAHGIDVASPAVPEPGAAAGFAAAAALLTLSRRRLKGRRVPAPSAACA